MILTPLAFRQVNYIDFALSWGKLLSLYVVRRLELSLTNPQSQLRAHTVVRNLPSSDPSRYSSQAAMPTLQETIELDAKEASEHGSSTQSPSYARYFTCANVIKDANGKSKNCTKRPSSTCGRCALVKV